MFLLRGTLVSFSVFAIVYLLASLAVASLWGAASRPFAADAPRRQANLLYGLRMAPLVLAAAFVVTLTVPAFLRHEPRGAEEPVGWLLLALSAVTIALVAWGVLRGWAACRDTARSVRRWLDQAGDAEGMAVVVCAPDAPPLALAGITRSKLLISDAARASLNESELKRSIAHELAHLRARDNLKRLLLHACAFPRMAGLERAWFDAIEMSADMEAVHSAAEALDLASALVKIARLPGGARVPQVASGLVDCPRSTLEMRVQRLLRWRAPSPQPPRSRLLPVAVFLASAVLAFHYPGLLQGVHGFTELLVR